jgi:hypothetical protein
MTSTSICASPHALTIPVHSYGEFAMYLRNDIARQGATAGTAVDGILYGWMEPFATEASQTR